MKRFIQLSDLHIRKDDTADENVALKAIVEYIRRRYDGGERPVVLLTGDITDDGHEEQYKNAVSIFAPLVADGFTVLACPGNHDYGPFGNFYTEAAQQRFQDYILGELLRYAPAREPGAKMEDLYPLVHDDGDVVYFAVDSVVANEDEALHFASGEVGEPQREKLKPLLGKHKGKTRVSFFHHHPFNRSRVMEMDDAEAVLRLLASSTEFLCFGHDHASEVFNGLHDIDWILASGKSTEPNRRRSFQFREARIGPDTHEVSMISFRPF